MTTVREYLEAIRDRSTTCLADYATCPTYENRRDAEAALAILDAAERSYGNGTRPDDLYRLMPDPERAA